MKPKKIIAFCGPAGSGKSFVSQALVEALVSRGISARIMPLAEPVKDIARQLGWDGQKDARGRRLLRILGTECGRAYDPDVWLKAWQRKASEAEAEVLIIDDLRFLNEAEFVVDAGGEVISVRRPGVSYNLEHPSEVGEAEIAATGILRNDDDLEVAILIRVEALLK